MPPAVLYRLLPGEGLDDFIRFFRECSGQDPLGTIFIVPTQRMVREILQRLQDEGFPVAGNAIATLSGFAARLFETHAPSWTIIGETEAKLVLSRLLVEHAAELPLLAGRGRPAPGVVGELKTLFSVLIARKVDYPAALGSLQSRKSDQIRFAFDAYLRFLEDHRLADGETLLSHAIRLLDEGAGAHIRNVIIYGLYEPMPLERDLICALRERAANFRYAMPYADNPAVFADDGSWIRPDAVIEGGMREGDRAQIAALFCSDRIGDCRERIGIAARKDRMDEVRAIAEEIRRLIDGGAKPGEIAVAFPDLATGAAYIDAVFPDFGIPYAVSICPPLSQSPLVQFLIAVLAVPAFSYRRDDVVALLASPYIGKPPGGTGRLPGRQVDTCARKARIVEGAASWDERLGDLIDTLEAEAALAETPERVRERLKREIAGARAARETVRRLFAVLAGLEGTKTLCGHLASYCALLDRIGCPALPQDGGQEVREREARDLRAFVRLLDSLERFGRMLPETEMTPVEFLSLLVLLVANTRAAPKRNRHAVQVLGIREAQHLAFPHLFLAGLVEGDMPRLTTRLPFSTDAETRRLGTRTGGDILREERYHFVAALLSAEGSLRLSYPESDAETLLLRSGFLDTLFEAASPGPWGSAPHLHSKAAAAALAGRLLAERRFEEAAALLPQGPRLQAIAARLNMENYHRRGGYDSACDCVLGGDPGIVEALSRRFGDGAVYSPTALEAYAECPFLFYMGWILSLEPLPTVEPDLTGKERGSLVHRIAFRFYSAWRHDGNGALTGETYPDALRRILAIGREEADRYAFGSPAWVVEKEHLLGSPAAGRGLLERFLAHELQLAASPFAPRHFELSFGMPIAAGAVDPASTPEPLAIPLDEDGSETILLRGRIDRVDVSPDGAFMVTDYKTGSVQTRLKDIMEGKALQLPLYLRAVELLTGLQGAAGAYYTVRRGDIRCRPIFWDQGRRDHFAPFRVAKSSGVEDIGALIDASLARAKAYLDDIRRGRFPPRRDAGPCPSYCGYRTVCRFDPLRLAALDGEVPDGAD